MRETMTMQEAEERERERRAAAWMAFAAGLLESEAAIEQPRLAVVDDGKVVRKRRPRRAARPEVAA